MKRSLLFTFLLLLSSQPLSSASAKQKTEPIRYTLSFPAPETHYMEVVANIPANDKQTLDLMMPVWTPGSYLVRDYSGHLENVTFSNESGDALRGHKTSKNHWTVETNGSPQVILSYRVYGRQMTVRHNWVEDGFALINGAPTFITEASLLDRPYEVELQLPVSWEGAVSSLQTITKDPILFRANDYDTLIDSPIVAGTPKVHSFEVDGKTHRLVNIGDSSQWDGEKSIKDLQLIVEENLNLWKSLPYKDTYTFFNVLVEGFGGGLEHKDSCTMMTSLWNSSTPKLHEGWLGLASHEFFHTWNGKRLRPIELGPFDYDTENYTDDLWLVEGFTSYYGDLILKRAGLLTKDQYLGKLSGRIGYSQNVPGRLVQSLSDASYDAWIRHYKSNENTSNSTVSYYTKGAVIGFLLDAKIRSLTDNKKSLDDLMRKAFKQFSGKRGYKTEEFIVLASKIAGEDLSTWFAIAVSSTGDLDYSDVLSFFGLDFKGNLPKDENKKEDPPKAWLGASIGLQKDQLRITKIPRETPALKAGLNVGDEIIAINGYRIAATTKAFETHLNYFKPGDTVTILISRRGKLIPIETTLESKPSFSWKLFEIESPTEEQTKRLNDWLKE
jgi:predicted metalloprotease with PDZ domain